MFENPRRGRQARHFTTNAPKILDLKSSSEQIFSRKLPLGAPGCYPRVLFLALLYKDVEPKQPPLLPVSLAWWWYHCVAISLETGSLFGKRVKKSRGENSDVNRTSHQSVFSPIGACIRIRCTASSVERRSQCLSTGSHPFPSPSSRFFHPFPKQRTCSQATLL